MSEFTEEQEDELIGEGFSMGYSLALEQAISKPLLDVVHNDYCDCCIGGFDADFYVNKMLETVREDITKNNEKEH